MELVGTLSFSNVDYVLHARSRPSRARNSSSSTSDA